MDLISPSEFANRVNIEEAPIGFEARLNREDWECACGARHGVATAQVQFYLAGNRVVVPCPDQTAATCIDLGSSASSFGVRGIDEQYLRTLRAPVSAKSIGRDIGKFLKLIGVRGASRGFQLVAFAAIAYGAIGLATGNPPPLPVAKAVLMAGAIFLAGFVLASAEIAISLASQQK